MKSTTPGMNVADLEKELVLEVAAPGLEKKDFKIQVEDDMLVISADKKQESAEQNDRYSRKEFSFQSFKRGYRLPSNVDAGSITALYENGILTIHVPKVIEINKNVKQIEVQ
jgi:HSP20 family protein